MPRTEDAERAFPGDGEMARRMRAHDWAATPLGEPSQWPSSVQTACPICLTSSFPMVVWWGEDLCFLYNDAYRPFLGTKHPALGQGGQRGVDRDLGHHWAGAYLRAAQRPADLVPG